MTDDKDDQKGGAGGRRDPRLTHTSRLSDGRSDDSADVPPAPLRPSAAMRTYLRPTKLQPRLNSETEETPIPANDGQERIDPVAPPPLPPSVVSDTGSPKPRKSAAGKLSPAESISSSMPPRPTPDRPMVTGSPKYPDRTQNETIQRPSPPPKDQKPAEPSLQTVAKPKTQKKLGLAARLFGQQKKDDNSAETAAYAGDEERQPITRRDNDEPRTHPSLPPIDANVETLPARPTKVPTQPRLILENVGLEIRSLGKHFKKRPVLRDVSLRVQRGEAVGLLGPNGAGKTTCFYIVTGLIPADYGEIFLDGQDITSLPMYRRARMGIGYLPQEASIFRGLTVEQNIRAVLELVEKDLERRETALESLLAEFSISHLRRTPAIALSGGERRRLEIARALASQPNFILLDEPLAGIDPIAVRDIRDLVSHLKDRGIGVLITDHNVRETLEIVDRAYILHDGNVLMEGPPEEIVANQEVRRVYLGDRFTL